MLLIYELFGESASEALCCLCWDLRRKHLNCASENGDHTQHHNICVSLMDQGEARRLLPPSIPWACCLHPPSPLQPFICSFLFKHFLLLCVFWWTKELPVCPKIVCLAQIPPASRIYLFNLQKNTLTYLWHPWYLGAQTTSASLFIPTSHFSLSELKRTVALLC